MIDKNQLHLKDLKKKSEEYLNIIVRDNKNTNGNFNQNVNLKYGILYLISAIDIIISIANSKSTHLICFNIRTIIKTLAVSCDLLENTNDIKLLKQLLSNDITQDIKIYGEDKTKEIYNGLIHQYFLDENNIPMKISEIKNNYKFNESDFVKKFLKEVYKCYDSNNDDYERLYPLMCHYSHSNITIIEELYLNNGFIGIDKISDNYQLFASVINCSLEYAFKIYQEQIKLIPHI